ncbi:MAG: outer membrane protein beta-barrel domain [Moraxellaceae bacterium]|jgi:hypothetical protein|nr:outer membrane protein beta-barrel domain [Moraxellaceae bacterium]
MKALALPLLLIALPAHADSQVWLDAYGGHLLEEEAGLSLSEDLLFGPDTVASTSFDPDSGTTGGFRVRAEMDPMPMGVAFDIGVRRTGVPQADLTLVPVTLGVTLPSRLTLARSAQLGSLHPTGLLGITATGVDGTVNIGGINSEITDNTWGGSGGRPGVAAALGLEWRFTPRVAVFTEYRYELLRFRLEHTNDSLFTTQYLQTTGRVESQSVMLGVSFRLFEQKKAEAAIPPAPAEATEP